MQCNMEEFEECSCTEKAFLVIEISSALSHILLWNIGEDKFRRPYYRKYQKKTAYSNFLIK